IRSAGVRYREKKGGAALQVSENIGVKIFGKGSPRARPRLRTPHAMKPATVGGVLLALLLVNLARAQIDWAEDDDDP
uniref:Uncharacterized protein n=1 Tax=Anopheles atroparvus TaxID=41427 RepID=A0AAG5CSF9_ANOAO